MRLAFDRGTVLVLDADDAAASSLPGVVLDPRVGAWRAPAYRYPDIRRTLLRAGIEHEGLRARAPAAAWDVPPLRDYQEAAIAAWQARGGRGTIVLPTGAGKTLVGIAAMARAGLPVLCIVPTRVLLHQWVGAIEERLRAPVGCVGDGRRDVRPVTVATIASAWRQMDRLGGRFGMLVVDEAHHFGGGQHDEALEMCAAPLRLGLTATPPADAVARETLERLVGPVVYQLSVDDLAGRYLAAYELSTLWIELTREERQAYEREMAVFRPVHRAYTSTSLDPSWPGFAAWAGRSDEGRRALAAVRRARDLLALPSGKLRVLESLLAQHRRRRVLVFTADNASAYAVSRRCLIHPITCDIGAKERDEVLARFRSGEIRALVSSRVLNEGLDVPDAEVGIVLGGRLGDREHVQRVGRVLRPADGKRALVYELVVQETTEVRAWVRRRRALASP